MVYRLGRLNIIPTGKINRCHCVLDLLSYLSGFPDGIRIPGSTLPNANSHPQQMTIGLTYGIANITNKRKCFVPLQPSCDIVIIKNIFKLT